MRELSFPLLELEWFKKISGLKIIFFQKHKLFGYETENTAMIDYVKTGISPEEKLRLLFWE